MKEYVKPAVVLEEEVVFETLLSCGSNVEP